MRVILDSPDWILREWVAHFNERTEERINYVNGLDENADRPGIVTIAEFVEG